MTVAAAAWQRVCGWDETERGAVRATFGRGRLGHATLAVGLRSWLRLGMWRGHACGVVRDPRLCRGGLGRDVALQLHHPLNGRHGLRRTQRKTERKSGAE